MSTNMLNGAQVIVDYLIQEKVPYAFGLCGHGNIQFIDALYERQSDIKTISVHHESVAGFMADVYYRVSGRPIATFTSCGPGSANLPISLGNAFLDSVPFMAVTGNVPTSQFNRGAFQELYRHYQADFPATVRSYCKKVFQPTRGEMVPLAVRQAWKTMVTGRPGPVVLDVPFDVFMEASATEAPKPQEWSANISCRCGADPEGVVQAVDMLLSAERPVIIVGQGVRYGGACDELLKLAERLQIPVAASASGLGAIDASHPLALGLVARGGHYQANHATRQADVLLALGMRFDDRTSSSWIQGYSFTIPPTKLIHVDIDPEEIGRNYPVALGLMADVRTFLRQLHAELDRRSDLNKRADARKKWLAAIDGYRKEWDKLVAPGFTDDSQPINPQRAAFEIDRGLPKDAIMVSDIGVHHNWLLGYCKPRRPDSLIGSMGFGPMGFGVAGVLGAKFAGARSSLCVGVRRRRLLHARQRARHRGRIRSASGLGGVEQLRLCVDPRSPTGLPRRPRARDRLPSSEDRRALQSGLRSHGALGRRRRRARRSRRRSGGSGAQGHRGQPALSDRRRYRGRRQPHRCRSVGIARPRPEQAVDRQPI
jgi:acetolactate synthase-1/2/3 large subunit